MVRVKPWARCASTAWWPSLMPSVFASHAARAASAIDGVLAEAFVLHPRKAAPNGPPVIDTERTAQPFTAIFFAAGSRLSTSDNGPGLTKLITAPSLLIQAGAMPAGLRAQDRIERPDTGGVYEVRSVETGGMGRHRVELVQART